MSDPAIAGPRFFNRDLSWLAFNERVLAQTEDERLPLLERTKFCAIYASNLDEFFMKRVGLAKRRLGERVATQPRDGLSVPDLLASVRRTVSEQLERLGRSWMDTLVPRLAVAGIRLERYAGLTASQRGQIDRWFDANVFPILTPLAVDPSHRFPFISNLSENFGVLMRRAHAADAERVFARLKIPSVVRRFVPVETGDAGLTALVALDDVIEHNLERLFPGMRLEVVASFRVTRSAAVALDEDDDPDDVLEHVEDELRRRRFAAPVRLEAATDASDEVIGYIAQQLGLGPEDVYRRRGPLEYSDLFEIASLPRPDLQREPWTPVVHPRLRGLRPLPRGGSLQDVEAEPGETIFDRVRAGDVLLHHPYDSFEHSVERFIAEAASDPDVLAIKQTIYRTSPDSPFVRSLIRAAEAGKNVACLVELRARFDEERNVAFARQLELAGVHVAYGVVGLKTHGKLSLVVRREADQIRAYVHIGTGNYHPRTAQLYTDVGLLTCDAALTADAVRVFNTLTGHAAEPRHDRLLVAPGGMRAGFIGLIDDEITAARAGRPARIVAKMNQLEDPEIIDKLYEASAAGVAITCYVRGFCTLRPGAAGLSGGVRVKSIVGRFLEHSRIFHFAAGEEDPLRGRFYIGSADWMSRNLSDRVEIAAPVEDAAARARLWNILGVMERDRRNAWLLGDDGAYTRLKPDPGTPADDPAVIGTFMTLMREAAER